MYSFDEDDLKEAALKADEYYLNSLPSDKDIIHRFSHRFEKKMKKIIKQSKKEKSVKHIPLQRRVAILIISILILLASSLSVSAVRKAVFEFITKTYEKYTEIIFDDSKIITDHEFVAFRPSYIPDGFKVNMEDLDGSVYLEYVKDNDYIIYEQKKKKDVSSHINTEGIEIDDTILNGQAAKYYSNHGVQNLIWHDDSYMYSVSSSLSKEKVYQIAESVQ